MRYYLFLFLLQLGSLSSLGQSPFAWQHALGTTLNEDQGFAIRPLAGGYLVVGQQFSAMASALYLVRTNDNGDTLWTKKVRLAGFDTGFEPSGLLQDPQGNLVVTGGGAGTTPSGGSGDTFIVKLTAQGDTIWTRTFRTSLQDSFGPPVLGNDGSYVVAGQLGQLNRVLKISSAGAVLWNVEVNFSTTGPSPGTIAGVARAGAQGYLVFTFGYGGPDFGLKVVSLTEAGTLRQINPFLPFYPGAIMQDRDGNIVSYGSNQALKLTPLGDTLWKRNYPMRQARYYDGRTMLETADGSYVVLAEANRYSPTNTQFGLIRLSHEGRLLNDTIFYRAGDNFPRSVVLAPDGDYVLSGYTNAGLFGGEDLVLLKFRKWRMPLPVRTGQQLVESLKLYPNPATDMVQIVLPISLRRGQLIMYDLLGRNVLQQVVGGEKEASVHLAQLPAGMYLLSIRDINTSHLFSGKALKK